MRVIKPKLSFSKLSIFGCTVFMRKRDRDVRKLEPKAMEGKFLGYTAGDNGCLLYVPKTRKVTAIRDVIIEESDVGSVPHNTDARPTGWEVQATGDLAPRWCSSRRWQQRGAKHNYCNKGGVAWRREREHSRDHTETRCLRCWGSSIGWWIYCNNRESQRLGVTGRQWNGGLLTVKGSWLICGGTGTSGQGRAQTRDTSKECYLIFWRSQDPSCCDWGWLCGSQNNWRIQAMVTIVSSGTGQWRTTRSRHSKTARTGT